jgi:predicted nucleic acid-binding Zn ribbon protein
MRQSMKAKPITDCPKCKTTGSVKRLIGAGAGIIFKGSGFYATDYKSKGPTCATSCPASNESSEKKSDSPAPPCPAMESCPCANKD